MKHNRRIVFLAAVGLLSLAGCQSSRSESRQAYVYGDSELYAPLPAEGKSFPHIATINLSWIEGSIKIKQAKGPASIKESSSSLPLHYMIDGNVLNLHYVKSGTLYKQFQSLSKDLELTVPSSLKALRIDAISGAIEADSLNAPSLVVETISARVKMGAVRGDALTLKTISGEVSLGEVETDSLSVKTISGAASFATLTGKDGAFAAAFETTSGDFSAGLYPDQGYDVAFKSVSGSFHSDYDDALSYGDKKASMEFSSVSGSFQIKRRARGQQP